MSLWYNGGKHSEREVRHEKQEQKTLISWWLFIMGQRGVQLGCYGDITKQFMGTVRFSAMMVVDWDIGIGWNCWDSFAGWSLIRMGIWTWLNHQWSKWWTQEVDFLVIAWGHKTTMWSWWIYIAKWHPAILFLYQSPKWLNNASNWQTAEGNSHGARRWMRTPARSIWAEELEERGRNPRRVPPVPPRSSGKDV